MSMYMTSLSKRYSGKAGKAKQYNQKKKIGYLGLDPNIGY